MLVSRIPRQAYFASCAADFSKWPLHALAAEYARVKAEFDAIPIVDPNDGIPRPVVKLADFVADATLYPSGDINGCTFRCRTDLHVYFHNFENMGSSFMADKLRGLAIFLEAEEKRFESRLAEGDFVNAARAEVLSSRMSVLEDFMCWAPCNTAEDAAVKLRFATEHCTNMDCDWDQRDLIIKSVLSFLSAVKHDADTSTALQVAVLETVAEHLG